MVVLNLPPGETRPTFYEPFGGKAYYAGVQFRDVLTTPGVWTVIVWDPYAMGGDYVLTIGEKEQFAWPDILRALANTPYIRKNKELHAECPAP